MFNKNNPGECFCTMQKSSISVLLKKAINLMQMLQDFQSVSDHIRALFIKGLNTLFYKQSFYKKLAVVWEIAKQLSGLNPLSLVLCYVTTHDPTIHDPAIHNSCINDPNQFKSCKRYYNHYATRAIFC